MDYIKRIDMFLNGTFNDSDEIIDMVGFLIDYKNLSDYVNSITINDKNGEILGSYVVSEKNLCIYRNALLRTGYCDASLYDMEFNRSFRLITFLSILHELKHAYQNKMADQNNDDFYSIICNDGIKFETDLTETKNPFKKLYYYSLYDYFILERDAEVSSLAEIFELNNEYRILSKSEKDYIETILTSRIIKGYHNGKCPMDRYLKIRNKEELYNLNFNDENIPTELQASLGLKMNDRILRKYFK